MDRCDRSQRHVTRTPPRGKLLKNLDPAGAEVEAPATERLEGENGQYDVS
jgi:hypothetical protein